MSTPTAAEFLATQRGGGLYSEAVNQRIGARLAVLAHRLRLAPTVLTLANLLVGVGGSVLVVVLPGWPGGLAATLLWQLAYSLDCADGQLARVTGRASPEGARVDILCDAGVQISLVTAVVATAAAHAPAAHAPAAHAPAWLGALFAGTWMVNLVTSVLAGGPAAASLLGSGSRPLKAVKLVRDYGAMALVCGLVIAVAPEWTGWLMAAFCMVNGGFLVASTAQAARASLSR